ncbi:Golgi-associated plant pathogenesis-related protein 1-like [Patiria miniata]|uniref:SCP domain-containing protein n=1 Tax=Patiria miniata TaxID=46514 RepID=A0A913Z5I1_PATMI|nr:Golgi-associated plant pathogenesis-related protein 1-like [Patiria miniata]
METMDRGGKEKLSTFQKDALSAHNRYREKHGVGTLKLSDDLCAHAQQWAEHLASTDTFKHSNKDFGENIAMNFSSQTTEYTGNSL